MQSVQSRTNTLAWIQDETGRHGDLIPQMGDWTFWGRTVLAGIDVWNLSLS